MRFELAILAELGFGLDLTSCAATGAREDLIYVSPKSGRAVSRTSGAPYHDRMLPLPAFLGDENAEVRTGCVAEAFRLTGYFLERDVFQPRGLQDAAGAAGIFGGAGEGKRAGLIMICASRHGLR